MRTPGEIVARIAVVDSDDFFGTIKGNLIECLPFEAAKPWLVDDATPEVWGEPKSADADDVKARMLDYMPFAWGKANGHRGLSAARSLDHMKAWLWLLGEDDATAALGSYSHYGKPQLRAICEHYGWDWRQWDDDQWSSSEDGPYLPASDVPPAAIWPTMSPALSEGVKP